MIMIQKERPDTHFIIAGNEGDDSALRALAAELSLDRGVHFVGKIPHDELPAYLVASDAFLSVPSVDATAVSLLEAMACGTPVVAFDVGGLVEGNSPFQTAWLSDEERDGYLDRVASTGANAQPTTRAKGHIHCW